MISLEHKLANTDARAFCNNEQKLITPYPFYSNFDDTYQIFVQLERSFKYQFKRYSSVHCMQMLTKFISIGSYSPEVHAFGTLITSSEVFRLIICKSL